MEGIRAMVSAAAKVAMAFADNSTNRKAGNSGGNRGSSRATTLNHYAAAVGGSGMGVGIGGGGGMVVGVGRGGGGGGGGGSGSSGCGGYNSRGRLYLRPPWSSPNLL